MKKPYEASIVIKASSASDVDLMTELLPPNSLFCLQRVAVTDDTTDTKTASIGIVQGSNPTWLETLTLTSKALWYALKEPIWFKATKRVIIRFHSPTSGDTLRANVFGYIEE